MDYADIQDLSRRISALEATIAEVDRRRGRTRRGFALAFALSACGLAALSTRTVDAQSERAKVVEAERFVLRDRGGKARVMLSTDSWRCPHLILLDDAGRTRARLFLDHYSETPDLDFYGENDDTRVSLGISMGGNAGIYATDRQGRGSASLCVTEEGVPSISIDGADGYERATLSLYSPGMGELLPELRFTTEHEKKGGIALRLRPDKTPQLVDLDDARCWIGRR